MGSPVGVITYRFFPNEEVWVIYETDCSDTSNAGATGCSNAVALSVEKGTVIRVRAEVLVTETTVEYDIRRDGQTGTDEFVEADVFETKTEALVEYGDRID